MNNFPIIHYACIKTALKKTLFIICSLFVFMAVSDWLSGERVKWDAFLVIGPSAVVVMFIIFYVISKLFPVRLFENEIKCSDPNGKFLTIKYGDAKSVELISKYGFDFLYVTDVKKQVISIPLFLPDLRMFLKNLKYLAGENNIIFQAVSEYAEYKK